MIFANQRAFDRPEARLQAMGVDWIDDFRRGSGGVANGRNGGLSNPEPVALPAGTKLVRFTQTGLPLFAISGGWWLAWDQYKRVEQTADARKMDVAGAIRALCCVPVEWNVMDIVVQVSLALPLMAYEGIGRPADTAGDGSSRRTTAAAALDGEPVRQLFVPGMGDPDMRHDAIASEGHGPLVGARIYTTGKFGR